MKTTNNSVNAYFWAIFGLFLASLGPSIFKEFLKESKINTEFGVALFLLLGGFSVAIVFAIEYFRHESANHVSLNLKVLVKLIFSGVFMAGQFFLFTISMLVGSVTETAIMIQLSPLIACFLSALFLDEKIENWKYFIYAGILCVGGAFLIEDVSINSIRETRLNFMIVGVLCAMAMAGKNVIQGSIKKYNRLPSIFIVSVTMILGAIFVLIFVDYGSFVMPNFKQFVVLVFLGIFTIAIPTWTNLYAYHILGSMGKLSFFTYLFPIMCSIAAFFINQERGFDYNRLLISFMIISIGIYFADLSIKKHKED